MSFSEEFKKLFPNFLPHQKKFFFFLTLFAGIAFLIPQADFQHFIAQGDHGRDLYCFKKTLSGALPYRDYSWVLGPLMPYYYALIFKIFGATIQSAVLGQNLLVLACGMTLFGICSIFLSPAIACACALCYWAFRGAEFFYTYVHISGTFHLLLVIYFLFNYLARPRLFYVIAGTLALILLMLIRINIGLCALLVFFGALTLADHFKQDPLRGGKRLVYFFLSLFISSLVFLIYATLLSPLPDYVTQQSLPYLKSHRTDIVFTFGEALRLFGRTLLSNFWGTLPRQMFSLLLLVTTWQAVRELCKRKLPKEQKINLSLAMGSLWLLAVLNLHEFIASGIFYRLLWVLPAVTILVFFILEIGTRSLPTKAIRILLITVLFFVSFLTMVQYNLAIDQLKKSEYLFTYGKNRIYCLQEKDWKDVVVAASEYLKKNVPPDETFLALPFEPLYYFLTEKDSPTRQLIFFEHINIPPQQEEEILADLKRNRTTYILFSNRGTVPIEAIKGVPGEVSIQAGIGIFGKDYGPLLYKYVEKNYHIVAIFGNWNQPAGWCNRHAAMILKKN